MATHHLSFLIGIYIFPKMFIAALESLYLQAKF